MNLHIKQNDVVSVVCFCQWSMFCSNGAHRDNPRKPGGHWNRIVAASEEFTAVGTQRKQFFPLPGEEVKGRMKEAFIHKVMLEL